MSVPDDPTRPLRADALPPNDLTGVEVDGYRVVRPLGQGGMGRVYEAFDTRLRRRVAIKVMGGLASPAANALARFRREAEALAALNHPNVAQIYAAGSWRGLPYYVMELIEGESLAAVLEHGQRLAGRRCLSYLIDAARGLDAALEKGIVHRDVKPANLLLDASETLKVVDFGIARRLGEESSLTSPHAILGTPRYMAPEQILGETVDHRADIYSLGASFYHLFAGEPPFGGDHPIVIGRQHVEEPLTPLRARNPRVPTAVDAVIGRMMAKRPEDRYQDYQSLIGDLVLAQHGGAQTPAVAAPRSAAVSPPGAGRRIHLGLILLAVLGVGMVGLLLKGPGTAEAPPTVAQETPPSNLPDPRPQAPVRDADLAAAREAARDGEGRGEPPDLPSLEPPDIPPDHPQAGFLRDALARSVALGTQANLRNLSNQVQVYLAEKGDLPPDLDTLAELYELHPKALVDAWGRPILYEPGRVPHFRLRSTGPDGVSRTADDLVLEDGYFVSGD